MLIDPEHCYNSFTVIHFRLPYKIIYNWEEYQCTLVYQKEHNRFVSGNVLIEYPFNSVTPENIKQKVIEYFKDPLAEIELLKTMMLQYKDFKLEMLE